MTRMHLYAERAILPDPHHLDQLRVLPALLTIEGAWIVDVEIAPADGPPAGADALDPHLVLAPAFVDAHTHLALHGLRGVASAASSDTDLVTEIFFAFEEGLNRDDVRALSRIGALEALLAGTAVVHDHYYHAEGTVDALLDTGLAGLVAPALQDLSGPGAHSWPEALDTTRRIDNDPSLAERGIGAMVGPHATDTVSDALWEEIAALADARDLPVHTHLAQSLGEHRAALAQGHDSPLRHLHHTGALDAGPSWQLVHGVFLDGDFPNLLDPERHLLVACPRSQARFAIPSDVPAWHYARWPFAVGSDAAASNDALQVQAELAAIAALWPSSVRPSTKLHKIHRDPASIDHTASLWFNRVERLRDAPSTATLWRAITEVPGSVHPRLPCGALEPGRLAHLAVWDTQHPSLWPGDDIVSGLVYGCPQGALAQLMVAGRWLGPRGCGTFQAHLLRHPEVAEWKQEATERRRALLAREP